MQITLQSKDIESIYIHNVQINLKEWLESNDYKECRKECDYFDDKKDDRVIDEEVRKCYKYENINVVFKNINEILDKIQIFFKDYVDIRFKPREILEYQEGCFFDKHTDGKKYINHIGNAILIPPKELYHYTGGTLIANGITYTPFKNKWKLVILPMDTEHYITKVKSGTRVVIKFNISGKLIEKPKTIYKTSPRRYKHKPGRFTNGRKD